VQVAAADMVRHRRRAQMQVRRQPGVDACMYHWMQAAELMGITTVATTRVKSSAHEYRSGRMVDA